MSCCFICGAPIKGLYMILFSYAFSNTPSLVLLQNGMWSILLVFIPLLLVFLLCSWPSSNSLSIMMKDLRFFWLVDIQPLLILHTIFLSGIYEGTYVKSSWMTPFSFDWFLKSLLPVIEKVVTLERLNTKEEAIMSGQHYDLISIQLRYLYLVILDAPCLGPSCLD